MNVFFDTNVVLEFIFNRRHAASVGRILERMRQGELTGFISSGSLYTMTYLVETEMKERGQRLLSHKAQLRSLLKSVVTSFNISDMARRDYFEAIADEDFKDIEDSYQYRHALTSYCQVLLTLNTKDYKGIRHPMTEIMTPAMFCKKYGRKG